MTLRFAEATTINEQDLTPAYMNDFMKRPNTYFDDDHNVRFDVAAGAVSGGHLKLRDLPGDQRSTDTLQQGLCNGFPVIVGVDLTLDEDTGQEVPGHYVLVTGKQDNNFTIVDPG